METADIARDLVRALRGKRSQNALSKRLGFTTNVVYSWEAGRRAPTALDFFRLARAVGIDVERRVAGFFPSAPAWLRGAQLDTSREVTRLVVALAGDVNASRLAQAVRVNRATVTRWLAGTTLPKLPDLLRVVDACQNRLLDFVALFADPAGLPSTREAHRDLSAQRRVAFDLPLSHAVLRALELEAYRRRPHRPGFIARATGISVTEEKTLLEALEAARIIELRDGVYRPTRVLTVDTRSDPEKNWQLKAHWARFALERLERTPRPESALFSYNLFAISREGFERLRRLQLEYYDELRRIVSETTTPECVALTNLQLLRLDE